MTVISLGMAVTENCLTLSIPLPPVAWPECTITAEFSAEDVEVLREFARVMTRVKDTALVRRNFTGLQNIRWEAGKGMTFSCEPYENAELHELLHVLRPVMLKKERASFHSVLQLLENRFTNEALRAELSMAQRAFEHGRLNAFMQVNVGETPLLHGTILHTWLNGTQYHSDKKKAEAWSELEKSLREDNARALIIEQVYSRVTQLLWLDDVIGLMLLAVYEPTAA